MLAAWGFSAAKERKEHNPNSRHKGSWTFMSEAKGVAAWRHVRRV